MLQLNYNNQSTSTVPIRISSITRFITTMSLHNNSLKKYSNYSPKLHKYTCNYLLVKCNTRENHTQNSAKSRNRHNISKLYYSTTTCTKLSKIQLSRNTQYSAKSKTREIIQTTRQTCTNIQAIIILIAYQQMYWFDRQYILLPNQTQQAQATIAIT